MMRTLLKLPAAIAGYKLARSLDTKPSLPINITISVTNSCNSRCKTCFIWKLYHDRPELKEKEFQTWEFEKTFESLGKKPIWFTLSGGEPFLRHDIAEICGAICEYCSPYVITIPTNALLPTLVEEETRKVLEQSNEVKLVVNLSLDGIGEKHDEVRGIPGNFNRFLDTFQRLKKLKKEFPNLNIGIHSVVSRYNIDHILQLYDFAKTLDPDSYISEIAEERTELFNMNHGIVPNPDQYADAINLISENIMKDYLKSKGFIPKVIQSFRLLYYQMVTQENLSHKQIVPCYAGYASCQITAYGDVWPCCILGYDKPMGNLRDNDYYFKKVWLSEKANEVRRYIRGEECTCPLANSHYTNILCSFEGTLRVFRNLMTLEK